jgi:hypothetical protein
MRRAHQFYGNVGFGDAAVQPSVGVSVLDPITPPTPSRVWRPDNEKNQQYKLYPPYTSAPNPLAFLDTPL